MPKEVADAAKEGSSVTQSTMVNQVNMAPNIADGDVLKAAETQRDDAMPAIQSSGRSPEASLQSPDGQGAAALQSQSEAQLQGDTTALQPDGADPATKQADLPPTDPKSAAEVPQDPKEAAADKDEPAADAQPSDPVDADKPEEAKDDAAE